MAVSMPPHEGFLLQAYAFLRSGDTSRAKSLTEDALSRAPGDPEAVFALNCVNFWSDTIVFPSGASSAERGAFLLERWKQFASFAKDGAESFERCFRAAKIGVFSRALDLFLSALNTRAPDAPLFRSAGVCYKKLGDYETALSYFREASSLLPADAAALAEMADCYALCGNERAAKALFRDAFLASPASIDAAFLDSRMIRDLFHQVEARGFSGAALLEWTPVYGALLGVFSVKRGLRPHEAARLERAAEALEREAAEGGERAASAVPRLLNHYFWLVDHYAASQEARGKTEEILLKIKTLDADVYRQYAGAREIA